MWYIHSPRECYLSGGEGHTTYLITSHYSWNRASVTRLRLQLAALTLNYLPCLPTPGFVAYTNIQSITNQSINPALNSLIDWLFGSLWIDWLICYVINQSKAAGLGRLGSGRLHTFGRTVSLVRRPPLLYNLQCRSTVTLSYVDPWAFNKIYWNAV